MTDPIVLAVVGLALLALVAFLVMRNRKDKEDLEERLNQGYRKPRDGENDIEADPESQLH